jgi:hypothetical protein
MSKSSLDLLQPDLYNKIKDICDPKQNIELEVSFGSYKQPISLKKFHNLLKYLKYRSTNEKLKLESSIALDMNYTYDQKTNSTYRMSIYDVNNINNFIQNNILLKNHTIFSKQLIMYMNMTKEEKKNYEFMNKIKTPSKFIALDEYDCRIKVSEESDDISESEISNLVKLQDTEKYHISFRYKQRISLILEDTKDYIMRIDLTDVKSTKVINNISDSISNYELETDITFKKSVSDTKLSEIINKLGDSIIMLEKFLQESQLLITKSEQINVIKNLNKLAYEDENESYKDLPAMQSSNVEVQHILDYIPGNYSVTDKADGERYFLMIYDDKVYLISNNLNVKKIKDSIGKNSQYNLTIIDGEYLYIPKYRKFLFLAFDLLFFQGKDVRDHESLKQRLLLTCRVLQDVFNVNMLIGDYELTDSKKDYNIKDICKYHEDNIKTHIKQLNEHLEKSKDNQVINCKYFLFPNIGNEYLIYKLSTIMYEFYTSNSQIKCPYLLDGLIYTPKTQKYTRNLKDTKFKILKWKPETTNSIDFYIQFERNPDTNKIVKIFDRTNSANNKSFEEYIDENKDSKTSDFNDMIDFKLSTTSYHILNLYVGRVKNNIETPYPFRKDEDLDQAYVYIEDGYSRTLDGDIIQDGTVVEFTYDMTKDTQEKFKWQPLRTRYDKTESVMRFKRKYGNNYDIANRVWNSIKDAISFNDLLLLADPLTNDNHIKYFKSKISSEIINITRRDDSYYQLTTNLGKNLRYFHNWIKSNMIYTYCSKKTLLDSSKVSLDILDIGVGRGGDLMKFYHSKVKSIVGIDVNESGIFSGSDGAISRYNIMKKKMPGFPKMTFIVADAGYKFDYNNQYSLGKMNDQNAKMLKHIFGENDESKKYYTFDVINAQFMIHYLLRDTNTWSNFCSNVNKYLRKDGYLLITTLDGKMVDSSFKNDKITQEYINEDGQNKTLFDIVKKYDKINFKDVSPKNNLGLQIDVHMPIFMDENMYQTEYLVNPAFLISQMKKKCNMRLIESESFQNLYYIYKDFFENTAQFESKLETRKFFNDVKQFYNLNDEISKKWFEYSKLNRYYIFQKK